MELKNHGENCLLCKCRSCNNTYNYNPEKFACIKYCDQVCEGKMEPEKWEEDYENECFQQLKP